MSGSNEQAAEVIRLLRGQKHDILNHLQVISGFLQLHKADRALDYTREAIRTITGQGRVLSLRSSDLALCLLLEAQRAIERDVAVTMEVTPVEVEGTAVPFTETGIVQAAWEMILEALAQAPAGQRYVKVRVLEKADSYTIHFYTPLEREKVEILGADLQKFCGYALVDGVFLSASLAEDGRELVIRVTGEHTC